MLVDFKIAILPIQETFCKQVVEVVRENLNAFAPLPTDLGITSFAIYTIKTGDAHPFRHKLRAIPFARRRYVEQEVEKLMSDGAIFSADPGACTNAFRIVISPTKGGSLRMCVDYHDIKEQSEK